MSKSEKDILIENLVSNIGELKNKVEDLENIVTVVTRLLMSKKIYEIEDVIEEYENIKKEKAEEKEISIHKINLEGDIKVEDNGIHR